MVGLKDIHTFNAKLCPSKGVLIYIPTGPVFLSCSYVSMHSVELSFPPSPPRKILAHEV